jgi:hypothetical protein
MVSHKKLGGLMLSIGGGGLRFKKRASGFNIRVGNCMKGKPGPSNGGRYDKRFQNEFKACVQSNR